jgi:hypothetical protein
VIAPGDRSAPIPTLELDSQYMPDLSLASQIAEPPSDQYSDGPKVVDRPVPTICGAVSSYGHGWEPVLAEGPDRALDPDRYLPGLSPC